MTRLVIPYELVIPVNNIKVNLVDLLNLVLNFGTKFSILNESREQECEDPRQNFKISSEANIKFHMVTTL